MFSCGNDCLLNRAVHHLDNHHFLQADRWCRARGDRSGNACVSDGYIVLQFTSQLLPFGYETRFRLLFGCRANFFLCIFTLADSRLRQFAAHKMLLASLLANGPRSENPRLVLDEPGGKPPSYEPAICHRGPCPMSFLFGKGRTALCAGLRVVARIR